MHTLHNQNKKYIYLPDNKIYRVPGINKIKEVNFLDKNKSKMIKVLT